MTFKVCFPPSPMYLMSKPLSTVSKNQIMCEQIVCGLNTR